MVRIPQLTELAVADFGNGDYMVIYDSDTGVTTKLTKANLIQSLVGTFGSSVSGTLVGGKAVVSTGVGTLGESSVTTTELSYVGGATSAIQTQLNALSVAAGVSYTPTTATQNTIQPENATSPNLTLQMLAGQTAAPLRITSSAGTLLLSSGTNGQLISAITTGTAPLSIASTTVVSNLNADKVDGYDASAFSLSGHTHAFSDIGVGTTSGVGFGMSAGSSTASGAVLNIQGGTAGKSIETFDETNTSRFSVSTYGLVVGRTFNSSVATGTAPLVINSTTACTNLNADMLDGSHASAFATSSHTHGMSSLTGDTFTAGQLMGGTGAGGLLSKVSAGTAGQCLGWTTGGAFTAITPGTGSGGGATGATILYDAPSLWAMGTNAATIEQVTGSTSTGYVASYDDTVEEYRYGAFIVPSQINGSGTVSFSTISRTKNNTTGNMIWTYGQSSQASGASWDAAYTDHDSAATAVASNNSNTLTICTWSVAVSTLGWTADDLVQFRLSRDPSDTVVGDICLHALKITVPLA